MDVRGKPAARGRNGYELRNEGSDVLGWISNWIGREVTICVVEVDIAPYHFEDVRRGKAGMVGKAQTNLPMESSNHSSFERLRATPISPRNPTGTVGNQTPRRFARPASRRADCIVQSPERGLGQRKSRDQGFHPAFCIGSVRWASPGASTREHRNPRRWGDWCSMRTGVRDNE